VSRTEVYPAGLPRLLRDIADRVEAAADVHIELSVDVNIQVPGYAETSAARVDAAERLAAAVGAADRSAAAEGLLILRGTGVTVYACGLPVDQVWMAAQRRGIPHHQLAGDVTVCGRSMRTGVQMPRSQAKKLDSQACERCYPTGGAA
jgi:hypothetical protein